MRGETHCTAGIRVAVLAIAVCVAGMYAAGEAWGATQYPWLSWRHDLQNTGAAPDSGYPETATVLWDTTRSNEPPLGTPARCTTPVVVGGDLVVTTGNGGVVEAYDQRTGALVWTRVYNWIPKPADPPDTPPDWCQGSDPSLFTNRGVCGYKINGECPDWCFQCSDEPFDCRWDSPIWGIESLSVIRPLDFTSDWGVFVAGATIDPDLTRVYFGTMDGRFTAINLADGSDVWVKEPWKEPKGPNAGRPWYDQKYAWHLSPPSVYEGKLYFGSFLPSFYWIFKAFPFVMDATDTTILYAWPSFNTNYKMYWVGRDGWTYCADKTTGNIVWGWDPGG